MIPPRRELSLPDLPPRINELMRLHYRARNNAVQDWHAQMAIAAAGQDLAKMAGPTAVSIEIVDNRADLDARVKPLLDGLQSLGVLRNDKDVVRLVVEKAPALEDGAKVRVRWEPVAPVIVPKPKRARKEARA